MKKLFLAVLLIALVGAGAFAQLAVTGSAIFYTDNEITFEEGWNKFTENQEGLFYGPGLEILMGKISLGASANFSFYEEDFSFDPYNPWLVEMMDYDIMGYLGYHLFGAKAFLDPFIEGGMGYIARDYANEEDDPDWDNPIQATLYGYGGVGLGVNLGPIGAFVKGAYNFPFGEPTTGTTRIYGVSWDTPGAEHDTDIDLWYIDEEYELPEYGIKSIRWTVGVKLIL